MKDGFLNSDGGVIVLDMIKKIQENKQYLSDIDGKIGDGDHGINMNKGFTLCGKELEEKTGDMSYCFHVLSRVLMRDIGGSMGPLYGMFFQAMSDITQKVEFIDSKIFLEMIKAAEAGIIDIGSAEVGDKTLLDTLHPAIKAFDEGISKGFANALDDMKKAAVKGRDSTVDMVAKVGRASRLGERSRGVMDAGASSCCLIIESMADSTIRLISD